MQDTMSEANAMHVDGKELAVYGHACMLEQVIWSTGSSRFEVNEGTQRASIVLRKSMCSLAERLLATVEKEQQWCVKEFIWSADNDTR